MKNETKLRRFDATVSLLLFAALPLAGCGDSKKPAPEKPSVAATPARQVFITADDKMKYSLTEIHAKPGEALSVTLTNLGSSPKKIMAHNWILLAAGVDPKDFATQAALAVGTDYEPPAFNDRIFAKTRLLGPGDSDTVEFHAPLTPGRYDFLCTFPSHFQAGMKGVLIVE